MILTAKEAFLAQLELNSILVHPTHESSFQFTSALSKKT